MPPDDLSSRNALQHRRPDIVALHDLGHTDSRHAGKVTNLVERQEMNGQYQFLGGFKITRIGVRDTHAGKPTQPERKDHDQKNPTGERRDGHKDAADQGDDAIRWLAFVHTGNTTQG